MNYIEALDDYMHGFCMFLAAALHHEYKLPIGLMTLKYKGKTFLSHSWVIKNGKCIDIQGAQTFQEITGYNKDNDGQMGARYTVYQPTTLQHLEELAQTKLPSDEPDVVKALQVAKEFLKEELEHEECYSLS